MSDTTVDCEVQGEITKEGKAIHTALTLYGYIVKVIQRVLRGLSFGRRLAALAAQESYLITLFVSVIIA